MIFNIVSGKPKVATITVNAPAGTLVTCAQSPYSFSATVSGSSVSFIAPKSGAWAITATKGGTTKTASVSIGSVNDNKSVTFTFEYWIFKEGEGVKVPLNVTIGGTDKIAMQSGTISTSNTLDISNYSKLCLDYNSTGTIAISAKIDYTTVGTGSSQSRTTAKFNISYSGSHYVRIEGSSGSGWLYVYNWYLEA